MNKISQIIRRNTELRRKIKLIKIEIKQNESNIENLKKFKNIYDPLYFLYDKPNVKEPFLL